MRKYIILSALTLASFVLYLITTNGVELTNEIPEIFRDENIQYVYKDGFTAIESNDSRSAYPIIHNAKALYLLSGASDVIKNYYINQEKKELIIEQNIMSPKIRNGAHFQLVTVPTNKYQPIVENQKLKIRVKYLYLNGQSTYLEYDFQNKTTKVVETSLVGK
ncbi:MAG: hypothetical protein CVU90_08235 [Firmicutes bacterium HGW-Firmicutes-15]|nr:MAG: hypothetical protein CVU90_08235 [Firmicutes bacterium HGW-Firmicutes-15]